MIIKAIFIFTLVHALALPVFAHKRGSSGKRSFCEDFAIGNDELTSQLDQISKLQKINSTVKSKFLRENYGHVCSDVPIDKFEQGLINLADQLKRDYGVSDFKSLTKDEVKDLKKHCVLRFKRMNASTDRIDDKALIKSAHGNDHLHEKTAKAKKLRTWALMSVSNKYEQRICLDSQQKSFYQESNSFIDLKQGQSCSEFIGSTADEDNIGLNALLDTGSSFIGSQDGKIDDFISKNGNDLFCDRCFREKYTTAINTRDKTHKSENFQSTPEWIKSSDKDPSFEDFRKDAQSAITNHLVENIMKQEFMKLSIVMEQYEHAKAKDPSFPRNNKVAEYTCNQPEKLLTRIKYTCGGDRHFNTNIMHDRMKNVFTSFGMSEDKISKFNKNNKMGIEDGLSHILNKVNQVSPRDGSRASCGSVSRYDVAQRRQRDENTDRARDLFKNFLSSLIQSDQGSIIIEQFKKINVDPTKGPIAAQLILANALKNAIVNDVPENKQIRTMIFSPDALTEEQKNSIFISTGLNLPLDPNNLNKEVLGKLTGTTFRVFSQMASYNPNLFLFINNPNVRKKMSSSKDEFLNAIFSDSVNEDLFSEFSKKCEDSYKKIAQMICVPDGKLENFSKSDIAIAAQEISKKLAKEDPKRKDLAIIALGSEVCQQKLDESHVKTPQYLDLDQQLPASFAQSDFMRVNKNPHEFEDPNFKYKGISDKDRKEVVSLNKQNRLLEEANTNSDYFCDAESREYVRLENECINHDLRCDEYFKHIENDEVFYKANKKIMSSTSPDFNFNTSNASKISSSKKSTPLESLLTGIEEKNPSLSNLESKSESSPSRSPASIVGPSATVSPEKEETSFLDDISKGMQSAIGSSQQAKQAILPTIAGSTSKDDGSIPEKQKAIETISSNTEAKSDDLKKLSTSELKKMAKIAAEKEMLSKNDKSSQLDEYMNELEKLKQEKSELARRRQELEQSKKNITSDFGPDSGETSKKVSRRSEIANNNSLRDVAAIPSSLIGPQSSQENFSTQSADSSIAKGSISSAKINAKGIVLFLENPDNQDSLPIYLSKLEKYGLVKEPDYINFRENGRIIEVPGPNGEVISYVLSELSPELRSRLEKIMQERSQKDLNSNSIANIRRRPVMEVLLEQEAEVKKQQEQNKSRLAVYQEFIKVLK